MNASRRAHPEAIRAWAGVTGIVLALFVLPLAAAQSPGTDPGSDGASDDGYRIGNGDRVSIQVYDEPDLSLKGVLVKGDGFISFPLIGDLQVGGLTSRALERLVTRRLADGYLKTPNVTVTIDTYRLYYIKGEVKRPGGYAYVEGLTVQKAIALASGLTERASESKITLVRESSPDRPLTAVDGNTPVRPGDVITIGESFF